MFVGLVCVSLAAQPALAGQSDLGLRIQIVQGNNAQNVLEQIPPNPIVIRVIDRNNRPVVGATVVFTAPETGPSGDFASGLNRFPTITDEDGVARAPEYRPNDVPGTYQIQVQVDYLGAVAAASIRQTNLASKKSIGKVIVILVAAGVAGAAGTALAGRSGNKSSATPGNSSTPTAPGATIPTITFGGSSVTGKN
jgi:hypothetical protein